MAIKKYLFWGVLLGIIVWLTASRLLKENAPAQGGGNRGGGGSAPMMIKAKIIKPQTLANKIQSTGSVIANEEVELRSEVSGRVVRVYFREGSVISKNDLLIKINDAELTAQLERAESKRKLAESNEVRQRGLFEKNLASQNDYDIALNELNVAKADIELIKAQISKTEIRAPFNGVIGLKYVSEGSYITPTSRIASLQNMDAIKLDFSIPEKYSGAVRVGDDIEYRVEGSDKLYKGKVFAVEPKIELATRTLQLRAISTQIDQRVLPGAFANITLILRDIPGALMIPTEALLPELKGQRVFVYKSGTAVSQKVETGIRTEVDVQITDGIAPNDTIIITGLMQLRNSLPVRISDLIQ